VGILVAEVIPSETIRSASPETSGAAVVILHLCER
jgi:hypothetical protein